jgi:hypothetical protein
MVLSGQLVINWFITQSYLEILNNANADFIKEILGPSQSYRGIHQDTY